MGLSVLRLGWQLYLNQHRVAALLAVPSPLLGIFELLLPSNDLLLLFSAHVLRARGNTDLCTYGQLLRANDDVLRTNLLVLLFACRYRSVLLEYLLNWILELNRILELLSCGQRSELPELFECAELLDRHSIHFARDWFGARIQLQ